MSSSLVLGCFSNEAGAGSASIAHSAVRTKYSASEGLSCVIRNHLLIQ